MTTDDQDNIPDDPLTKEERLILLAMLAVPECRVRAGLPAYGPLTTAEIAGYIGLSPGGVYWILRHAMLKIRIKEASRYLEATDNLTDDEYKI